MGANPIDRKAVAVDSDIKAANLIRLRRIEGQIRGLQKMVEEDRYCPDILVQVASAHEALRAVGQGLMRNHLRNCATSAVLGGDSVKAEETYHELVDLIYKYAR